MSDYRAKISLFVLFLKKNEKKVEKYLESLKKVSTFASQLRNKRVTS